MSGVAYIDAEALADALAAAADRSPVRQIRAELSARAREWERAAKRLMEHEEGEVVIEMLSGVCRGMELPDDRYGWARVMRVMPGGLGLHLAADDSPSPIYLNFMHPTSPVVVRA